MTIVKESGIKYHLPIHIYIANPSQVGFQTEEDTKKSTCKNIVCITRREIRFQKKAAEILVGKSTSSKKKKRLLYPI
jgi:hypothetical protein